MSKLVSEPAALVREPFSLPVQSYFTGRNYRYVFSIVNKLHHLYPVARHPGPICFRIRILLKTRNRHSIEHKVDLSKPLFLAPDDWKGFRPDPHDFRIVKQDLAPNINQNI